MTIDEAIDFAEDINATVTFPSDLKSDEEFFDNIPKWLEELKIYKESNISIKNYQQGRADAIEDCIKSIQKQFEYRDNQGLPHYALYAWINITSIRNMLEELKEQKNE